MNMAINIKIINHKSNYLCMNSYAKNRKSVEMIKSQPEIVTLFAAFKPL